MTACCVTHIRCEAMFSRLHFRTSPMSACGRKESVRTSGEGKTNRIRCQSHPAPEADRFSTAPAIWHRVVMWSRGVIAGGRPGMADRAPLGGHGRRFRVGTSDGTPARQRHAPRDSLRSMSERIIRSMVESRPRTSDNPSRPCPKIRKSAARCCARARRTGAGRTRPRATSPAPAHGHTARGTQPNPVSGRKE